MLVSWYKKSQLGKQETSHNTLMTLSILTYTEVIPETAPESDTSFLQHDPSTNLHISNILNSHFSFQLSV